MLLNVVPFVYYKKVARGIPTQCPTKTLSFTFYLSNDLIEKNQMDISGVQIKEGREAKEPSKGKEITVVLQ